MARTLLYFRIELEHGGDERLDRVVADIERQIRKVHGVRAVEFTNSVSLSEDND